MMQLLNQMLYNKMLKFNQMMYNKRYKICTIIKPNAVKYAPLFAVYCAKEFVFKMHIVPKNAVLFGP